MAITKIHAVKATVHKAIAYICNPHKTDEGILISSFGCSPETAAYDFRFALSKTNQSDPNQAFHLIQSFAPNEVSFKEAHKVGVELADKLLEGKYSYVVTTHIDKGHVHNHIIFCAADNIDHKKYHDCKQTYRHIRKLSDSLCREHNLSVIVPSERQGMKYNEWQTAHNQSSWKQKLRDDIDSAIQNSKNYEECIEMIRAKGYEIRGESLESEAHKYITFRPLDKTRAVRGSAKSLGAAYTKENIKKRIEEKNAERSKATRTFIKHTAPIVRRKNLTKDYSKSKLIDTSEAKFTQSPGLNHWATIQNLKIAAASYASTDSMQELTNKIEAKTQLAKTARATLVDIEHQLRELGEILKYAESYTANRKYNYHYHKAKDQDAYLRRRETELLLYDGAVHMLKQFGINPATMDLADMKAHYHALEAKKIQMQQTYKSAEKDAEQLRQQLANIQQYIGQTPEADIENDTPSRKEDQSL